MNVVNGSGPGHEQIAATIRGLIAKQLHVKLKQVTDGARLVEDLHADWLDRLELMMAIEDQFAGLQIGDDDADRMVAVCDLIRFVAAHPS
jgi:acyl carrier protein